MLHFSLYFAVSTVHHNTSFALIPWPTNYFHRLRYRLAQFYLFA